MVLDLLVACPHLDWEQLLHLVVVMKRNQAWALLHSRVVAMQHLQARVPRRTTVVSVLPDLQDIPAWALLLIQVEAMELQWDLPILCPQVLQHCLAQPSRTIAQAKEEQPLGARQVAALVLALSTVG
mmetsp:Transcript_106459/g.211483  ORF Transcript_106459/g.211483 Transcript_106459/m.211483 type:complete len:127 (-) Transcript_106459:481-861(-)